MHFYKTLLHVSGISIVEILFYFYYIGPLETDIFTKEFKSLINSMNSDFSNNEMFLSFQEIYKEHYQYNETVEKILIEKQNNSLEEMKSSKHAKPDAITFGTAISVFQQLACRTEKGSKRRYELLAHCDELYEEMTSNGIKSRVVNSMMSNLPGRGL